MLYKLLYETIRDDCILVDDNDIWYVKPDYRYYIYTTFNGLHLECEDYPFVRLDSIGLQLKLLVLAHNKLNDHSKLVVDFIYSLLVNQVLPMLTLEQNIIALLFILFLNKKEKKTTRKKKTLPTN